LPIFALADIAADYERKRGEIAWSSALDRQSHFPLRYPRSSDPRTLRSETDQIAKSKYDASAETDRKVVERVAEVAEKHGVPRVHIALAWLLQKKPVTAPIIGATQITHLENAVDALPVQLTEEDVASLEEPCVPHAIVGHQ
jgi:aryl-alcohol dehydrogenase-like predicted oxidoreductase